MDWRRAPLETSPMTALFLTIAPGYLVGELNLNEMTIRNAALFGSPLPELQTQLPSGVQVAAIRGAEQIAAHP